MKALHPAVLLLAAALAGCAQTPKPTASTSGSRCDQLAAEIARTEATRKDATDKADTAWKAVLPFAVVARKLSGKADADQASKQLAELKQQSRSEGCGDVRLTRSAP